VICLDLIWGVDLMRGFSSVVTFGVSYPLDQVLEHSGSSMTSVAYDALDLILFFPINQFWRRSGEVWSMGGGFVIGA
jgi:hypothetical protein